MDGFSYYNIFDTKGMEYIVIIAFLLLLIPFWLILNRGDRLRQGVRRALGVLTAGVLRVPQGIYHSQNHTWAFLERFGAARVGLDDLLMRITGEVELKFMRQPGETVRKGDLLAEIAQD
ncbi:MAG TPA: hypothetical protein P5248_13080, partial [Bacteroidales bacterium]|nr:hypothetical protein [Bacteroidales bacterium]